MKENAGKIIGVDQDVFLRELTHNDIPKLTEYANNPKISINLRDDFPNPYTIDDAKGFIEMANFEDPKTIFAIEYQGNYVGNISLMVGTDV